MELQTINFENLHLVASSHDSKVYRVSILGDHEADSVSSKYSEPGLLAVQDMSPMLTRHTLEEVRRALRYYSRISVELAQIGEQTLDVPGGMSIRYLVVPKTTVSLNDDLIGLKSEFILGPRLDELLDSEQSLLKSISELSAEEIEQINRLPLNNFQFKSQLYHAIFELEYRLRQKSEIISIDQANIKVRYNLEADQITLIITDIQTYIGQGVIFGFS